MVFIRLSYSGVDTKWIQFQIWPGYNPFSMGTAINALVVSHLGYSTAWDLNIFLVHSYWFKEQPQPNQSVNASYSSASWWFFPYSTLPLLVGPALALWSLRYKPAPFDVLQARADTPRAHSAAAQDIPDPAVQTLWGWVQLHCLWGTKGWKFNILPSYDSEHTMTTEISLPFFKDYTQILKTYSQAPRFGQISAVYENLVVHIA